MKFKNTSRENAQNLTEAYVHLYDSLVDIYMADGRILGQSQHDARRVMDNVVMAYCGHGLKIPNLMALDTTHKSVIARKSMESPHRNEIRPVMIDEAKLDIAFAEFEQALMASAQKKSFFSQPELPDIDIRAILKETRNNKKVTPTWLTDTANPADVVRLPSAPICATKLYHRQSQK